MRKSKYLAEQKRKHWDYQNVRSLICQIAKVRGYVIEPIILCEVFYEFLQDKHPSKMNTQQARTMSKVFSTLCHIYYIGGKKRDTIRKERSERTDKVIINNSANRHGSFHVAQDVWDMLCIGRSAVEESIKHLQEMGLISFYNHWYNNNPERRKRYYKIITEEVNKLLETAIDLRKRQDKEKSLKYADSTPLNMEEWKNFVGNRKTIKYFESDDEYYANYKKMEEEKTQEQKAKEQYEYEKRQAEQEQRKSKPEPEII